MAPANSAARWWAGGALLLGGALALAACFLPFSRIAWPPPSGEPPDIYIPVQPLLPAAGPSPAPLINTLCGALLLGAPAGLAALGAGLLWARDWAAGWRGFTTGFPLVAIGTGYTLINAAFALIPTSPNFPGIARTLEVGAWLMALGNLLALMGVVLMPRVTPSPAQPHPPAQEWPRG